EVRVITPLASGVAEVVSSPTSLNLQTNTSESATLNISLVGTGGPFTWNGSATTLSGGNWLSLSASSGAPGSVQVIANASGLPPGNYLGSVTITATPPGVNSSTVQVSLTVPSIPTSIKVDRNFLYFDAGNPVSQMITISNGGTGVLNWNASASVLIPTGGTW